MEEPIIKYQVTTETTAGQTAISLRLLMQGYTNRGEMAQRLRDLAHWVEEGIVCPFDAPEDGLSLRWDGQKWIKEG